MAISSDLIALKAAVAELSGSDPVIASLAQNYGLPTLDRKSLADFTIEYDEPVAVPLEDQLFSELVEVVIHQQLAGKAAIAITRRVRAALMDNLTPQMVIDSDPELLRASGLSSAKLSAICGLAKAINTKAVSLVSLACASDDDVTAELSKLKGFGPWSAQMFLMFSLGRMDIWPSGDLGVRKGYSRSYGLETVPSAKELAVLGERFRPFRSLAAWYMWKSLVDLPS